METVTKNPDLKRERQSVSFDVYQMSCFLHESKQKLERKRYIENLVISDKDFANYLPSYFLSLEEQYDQAYDLEVKTIRKLRKLNLTNPDDIRTYRGTSITSDGSPFALHRIAFELPVYSQGSEEQIQKWKPRIDSFEVLGSYSQTELAHGSNVRGLETTAVYDPKTEEFVLNTPEITSIKWWPGNLGRTCNHTLLMAQLYTKGEHRGLYPFIVQLRDIETHKLLPGVETGSIGAVVGQNGVDNGYLRLSSIRVPRENMLMRYAKVLPDGSFVPPVTDKVSYGGMLTIRAMIPAGSAQAMAEAATIATRYSLVRRQSEMTPGAPEPQVLDYQTQQYKVLTAVGLAYALWFSSRRLLKRFAEFQEELKRGNFNSMLGMHIASSCMKAYATSETALAVEVCRLACGGHGYSQASGLPRIWTSAVSGVTAEGDVTVLYLQTGRAMLKGLVSARQGGDLDSTMDYFKTQPKVKFQYKGTNSLNDLRVAFQQRALWLLETCAARVQKLISEGQSQHIAVNNSSALLVKAAKAHAEVLVLGFFCDYTSSGPRDLQPSVFKLCALFGLNVLTKNAGDFLEAGCIAAGDLELARSSLRSILAEVRSDAIGYVDAFDFRDRQLQSVLGRYDGNVYEELYKWAKQSPLNDTEVHESFYKYLKPMRDQQLSKL